MQCVLADGKHFRVGAAIQRRVPLFFIDDATRYGLQVLVGTAESSELFLHALYEMVMRHGLADLFFLDKAAQASSPRTSRPWFRAAWERVADPRHHQVSSPSAACSLSSGHRSADRPFRIWHAHGTEPPAPHSASSIVQLTTARRRATQRTTSMASAS